MVLSGEGVHMKKNSSHKKTSAIKVSQTKSSKLKGAKVTQLYGHKVDLATLSSYTKFTTKYMDVLKKLADE